MTPPPSEILTGIGLLLNIVGVGALTLTDLFTSKPIRMWWFYYQHVDREDPQSTEGTPPVDVISPVGGGDAGLVIPSDSDSYDNTIRTLRNQSIAAIGLIGGFLFQFVALFV